MIDLEKLMLCDDLVIERVDNMQTIYCLLLNIKKNNKRPFTWV